MGCLKIDIKPVGGTDVSIIGGNAISVAVGIAKRRICGLFKSVLRCVNDVLVSMSVVNDAFSADASFACGKPIVDLGVVCMTNLGTEYYLKVLDGYLITVDGCYMKVTRE